jgi:hypothetical protein
MENKTELMKELEQLKSRIAELEKSINEPTEEKSGIVTEPVKIGDVVYMIAAYDNDVKIKQIYIDDLYLDNVNSFIKIGYIFYDQESCCNHRKCNPKTHGRYS